MAIRKVFVFLIFAMLATSAGASTISILWEPSPSTDVVGYAIYYGNKSGDYSTRIDAGNQTNLTFQPTAGSNYFFVVTAYTSEGLESLPSNEASFQPEPYISTIAAGSFTGLFDVGAQSDGYFNLKQGSRSSFSGKIGLNGRQYKFSGKPDSSGVIKVVINRLGALPLVLTLNVDSTGDDHLTGSLTDGDWTMQLTADRANFNAKTNAAPFFGNYTVAVLGILGEPLTPGGIGFGSVKVFPNGMVKIRGTLGDGKNFANSTYISSAGVWPFYVSPYGKAGGSISGWLQFETNGIESIHGDLAWKKPALPRDKFYSTGFSNSVALIGSTYQAPITVTNQILSFTNGTLTVSGADLAGGFVKDVVLSSNKIIPAVVGDDRLSVRIAKASGLFSGKMRLPGLQIPIGFRGALLQNQNAGYGLFSHTNQVGELRLEPNL